MKSRYVKWGKHLVLRALLESAGDDARRVCPACDGLGFVAEQLDEEHYHEMVPCWRCKIRCAKCGVYYPAKSPHECATAPNAR